MMAVRATMAVRMVCDPGPRLYGRLRGCQTAIACAIHDVEKSAALREPYAAQTKAPALRTPRPWAGAAIARKPIAGRSVPLHVPEGWPDTPKDRLRWTTEAPHSTPQFAPKAS